MIRYGVEKGIYFSYPCISRFGTLAPVLNLPVDPYSAEMMEKCPSSPHPPLPLPLAPRTALPVISTCELYPEYPQTFRPSAAQQL